MSRITAAIRGDLAAMRERTRQEKDGLEEAIWKAKRTALPGMVPVLTFFNAGKTGVGVLALTTPKYTLTRFTPTGPSGHLFVPHDRLHYELEMEGYEPVADPEAGRTLEAWTASPEWDTGIKQTMFLSYWNMFADLNRFDLSCEINQAPDLDQALVLAARLRRQHFPNVKVL